MSELNATLPPGRHGLPKEFVAANQRTRLINGFAEAVGRRGYCAVTIAEITAAASVSRRTFYEHFRSKEEIAACLLVKELAKAPSLDTGCGVYAIETLMRGQEEPADAERSAQVMEETIAQLRALELPEPEQVKAAMIGRAKLGQERPRLSPAFIAASQRSRMVEAIAKVIVERRWLNVRVSDVVSKAAVARNTFYDQFANRDEAAREMIKRVSPEMAERVQGLSFENGHGAVIVEAVAYLIAEGPEAMITQLEAVVEIIGLTRSALDDD